MEEISSKNISAQSAILVIIVVAIIAVIVGYYASAPKKSSVSGSGANLLQQHFQQLKANQ